MTARHAVKLTANFEHNLEEVEALLLEAEAPQAFNALLDELSLIWQVTGPCERTDQGDYKGVRNQKGSMA